MLDYMNYINLYRSIKEIANFEDRKRFDVLYLYNKNLKINYSILYNNKQMIFADGINYIHNEKENQLLIEFHPLNELKESCSRLLIHDSIILCFNNVIYNLFRKIITTKDASQVYKDLSFAKTNLKNLVNPTKNTMFKFNNLFNILTATSFSKNIIDFSIEIISDEKISKRAKVNFIFPFYDALCTEHNNTICGIYFEDNEILLLKQIYENYILKTINTLFNQDLPIPDTSNSYPYFYALMTTGLNIQENFWTEYNISFIPKIKNKLSSYKEIFSNLNDFIKIIPQTSTNQQELDSQSYKDELKIRKESQSEWLVIKDNNMKEVVKKEQIEIITNRDKEIETFTKYIEAAEKKYVRQINNFLTDQRVNDYIQNYNQFKNDQEWAELFHWQNLVLNILNTDSASLWFDRRTDKYCFRSKVGATLVYENKEGISELLTRALKEKITDYLNRFNNDFFANHAIEIVLVHKLNGIQSQKLKQSERASNAIKILLFENAISTIDDDKFDVHSSLEFSKEDTHFFYTRNRFIPTKHLLKRFNNTNLTSNNAISFDSLFSLNEDSYLLETSEQEIECKRSSFIEDFIFYLVDEDIATYYYVMNWLSCFFNSLEKSGTTLVLLGDQEVTENILLDKIIKEIFGLQYCLTINDEQCKSPSAFDIVKDKLFFHIGDISNPATKFDDETLYKLVKDLLVKQSITRLNEDGEQEETIIHGQMIITAKNPAPYIKRALSKCMIIKVNDMDTIIEKLGVPDEPILEDKIKKDLENFTDIMQSFKGNNEFSKYALDTKYRQELDDKKKTSNINKEDVEKDIDDFIQAIKDKNIEYFEKVKEVEDGVIYNRLKNAFKYDDGYFIGQDLLHYYNSTHEQKFENKKQLMDKLKEKDVMFSQEIKTLKILTAERKEEVLFQAPKTTKETNYKELYKINDYTLAKDITIPYGAIITSSQDNIKKYKHPDLENALKIHKEYKEKKAKEKIN